MEKMSYESLERKHGQEEVCYAMRDYFRHMDYIEFQVMLQEVGEETEAKTN